MGKAQRPDLLMAVYDATDRAIRSGDIPTHLLPANSTLYRWFPPKYMTLRPDGSFGRLEANANLCPRDQQKDSNRFSGTGAGSIPPKGGLYCSMQQQAAVNESMHYNAPNGTGSNRAHIAMDQVRMIRIRTMCSLLLADLSPHNPSARRFVDSLANSKAVQQELAKYAVVRPVWEEMNDAGDYSVSRGIGLAIGNSGFLHGLIAATARDSERSSEEKGDNVVLFGDDGKAIEGLWIDRAYAFPLTGDLQVIPVEF